MTRLRREIGISPITSLARHFPTCSHDLHSLSALVPAIIISEFNLVIFAHLFPLNVEHLRGLPPFIN
jgi:hypothetical protein